MVFRTILNPFQRVRLRKMYESLGGFQEALHHMVGLWLLWLQQPVITAVETERLKEPKLLCVYVCVCVI